MAHAEWEFRVARPLLEGGTLRDAFRQYERANGKKHEDDTGAIVSSPDDALYLLLWFWDMSAGRRADQGRWLGLPPSEIRAWQELQGIKMRPWEVAAIRALDDKFLEVMAEK